MNTQNDKAVRQDMKRAASFLKMDQAPEGKTTDQLRSDEPAKAPIGWKPPVWMNG